MIKQRILRWRNYTKLPRWKLNAITYIIIKGGKGRFDMHRKGGIVTIEAEIAIINHKLISAGNHQQLEETRNRFFPRA